MAGILEEFFRSKSVDNLWLWKVFGPVITVGSGQVYDFCLIESYAESLHV
jgi:hypothetical protein